ncbi:DUF2950 domain-containing protein [Luteibacter sp. SG786]|uniref:DUF2950 domain-containing protein n=1 Tax=Luteibacter sp. SG786 TaxID=2587130 RepID=UPI00141F2EFB|nr:DUF2950 domain-containing protein [Luteibacter sp. SG786]NII54833.1 hypothetical protein [Luteibacter sp. SG786]
MGKVIEFLARVGSDASLRHASADAMRTALLEAGVDDVALGDALATNDGDALRALFGQREYISSQLPDSPAREEDPFDGEDDDDDTDVPPESISRTPSADPTG